MTVEEIIKSLKYLNSKFQSYDIDQDEYCEKAMDLVAKLGEYGE